VLVVRQYGDRPFALREELYDDGVCWTTRDPSVMVMKPSVPPRFARRRIGKKPRQGDEYLERGPARGWQRHGDGGEFGAIAAPK